jgi:hypothetical protein
MDGTPGMTRLYRRAGPRAEPDFSARQNGFVSWPHRLGNGFDLGSFWLRFQAVFRGNPPILGFVLAIFFRRHPFTAAAPLPGTGLLHTVFSGHCQEDCTYKTSQNLPPNGYFFGLFRRFRREPNTTFAAYFRPRDTTSPVDAISYDDPTPPAGVIER